MADHGVVPTASSPDKAAALLALHAGPGFVLPNAWDAGSARVLEQVGFPAIATTSAGIAWSCGVPDGGAIDRDPMLEHIGRIVDAVDVPVTADLEDGYGDTSDEVGRTVARAAELGAVGANIEDVTGGRLFGIEEAVDRLAAARAAAPSGTFVLNARTDTYFVGVERRRVRRDRRAGAPLPRGGSRLRLRARRRRGGHDPSARRRHPRPAQRGGRAGEHHRRAHALLARRQPGQPGRSLARASLSLLERAGRELLDSGTLGFLDGAIGTPTCSSASARDCAVGGRGERPSLRRARRARGQRAGARRRGGRRP